MIILPLEIAFKGGRDYLQGPDLLAGLLRAMATLGTPADGGMDVMFYRKTGRQAAVGVLEPDDSGEKPKTAIGTWALYCGGGRRRGWFLESKRPVTMRVPYDEDSVVATCAISENSIAFAGETDLTAPELCVAMTKALHIARFPVPDDKHWVVCRFALDRPLAATDRPGMRVVLESRLGTHLTRSGVFGGDIRLGAISFSPAHR